MHSTGARELAEAGDGNATLQGAPARSRSVHGWTTPEHRRGESARVIGVRGETSGVCPGCVSAVS